MSDAEIPSVFSDDIYKARKEHKCCECQLIIKIGERYHRSHGLWDGRWETFKTCMGCHELRYEVEYDGEYPPFGELREWAQEAGIESPALPC